MTQDERARRGQQAARLLSDPLLKEAFDVIDAEIVREWRAAPVRDADGRERLFLMAKLLEKLRSHFDSVISDGKLAEAEIAAVNKDNRKILGIRVP